MPRCDVVVIGAGPAGSAFAHELANAGFEVVVLEREGQGRDKPCGEGVQHPGLAVLARMGILEAAWQLGAPFRQIRFDAGLRSVKLALSGIAIARTSLDELAAHAAIRAGACIRWRSGAESLSRKGAQWEVQDSQGTGWRSPWVVGADGAHSWLRRRMQVRARKRHDRAGWVFHTDDSDVGRAPEVRVLCEQGAEVYTVPIGAQRRLVAWLGPAWELASSRKPALRNRIRALLWAKGLATGIGNGATVAPIASESERSAGPGWLLVGDAAGQIDPVLGMGISGALTSGVTAAHAVRAALHTRTSEHVEAFAQNQVRRLRRASWLADTVLAAARYPAIWPALQRLLTAVPDLAETVESNLFPDEMEHEYALPNLRPLFAHNS